MIGDIRRHVRLHDAITALVQKGEMQQIEIPEHIAAQYYQKYAHMLAARWGVKISTRVIDRCMLIGERRVRPEVHQ